jgi:hypothetical protein
MTVHDAGRRSLTVGTTARPMYATCLRRRSKTFSGHDVSLTSRLKIVTGRRTFRAEDVRGSLLSHCRDGPTQIQSN